MDDEVCVQGPKVSNAGFDYNTGKAAEKKVVPAVVDK